MIPTFWLDGDKAKANDEAKPETVLARRITPKTAPPAPAPAPTQTPKVPAPTPKAKPKRSEVAAAARKCLLANAIECTQYIARGQALKADLAQKWGVSEEAVAQILASECNDLVKHIAAMPPAPAPERVNKSCVVVV